VRHPLLLAMFILGIPVAVVVSLVLPIGELRVLTIVVVLFVLMLPYIYAHSKDRGRRFL
jgi:hypothetical protein